jgi:hypothetical protein
MDEIENGRDTISEFVFLYLNEVRPKFKKEKGLRPHSFPDPSCGRMK